MPVTTEHPDYTKFKTRWTEMDDALDEQDTIKARGETYLPRTSGMVNKDGKNPSGDERYTAYKQRARFPGIARQTLTGIVGLMFEKDPYGISDEPVTITGQKNLDLARDVTRDVGSYGRSVLLVDAPTEGGEPFIARYHPASLINWKVEKGNPAALTLVVLEEKWEAESDDEFSHETVARYRVYRKNGNVVSIIVYDENGAVVEEERILSGITAIPVIAIGSISVDPGCDPVPLLPVKDAAISIYQVSADLRQDLYMTGQKQPYMAGCSAEQYNANLEKGYGAGSCWYLGDQDGKAGLIESEGSAYADMSAERTHELEQAATYAVRMTQKTENAESGRALQIRAAAQHASIYTMADSISLGLRVALGLRAQWAGKKAPEDFIIRTEFTNEEAADQMINALNTAVNSGNAPRSAMFEAIRRSGLSEKTDDEMIAEIEASGGNVMDGDVGDGEDDGDQAA